MKDIELPPLPAPDHFAFIDGGHGIYVEGGPTGEPFYSAEQMRDYARAAVEADRAQRVPDVDALSNFIREIDGAHRFGAGALAERICEWLASTPAQPAQQERKPMTYREIADATSEWAHVRSDYTIGIIRAAERHHGIKE